MTVIMLGLRNRLADRLLGQANQPRQLLNDALKARIEDWFARNAWRLIALIALGLWSLFILSFYL